jgi:hypothetical protein
MLARGANAVQQPLVRAPLHLHQTHQAIDSDLGVKLELAPTGFNIAENDYVEGLERVAENAA